MRKIILFFTLLSLVIRPSFLSSTEKEEESYPVIILGGGVGALTSATYLARAGLQPLVLTGPMKGGMITMSHAIQNWPAEVEITGHELSEKLHKQAQLSGAFVKPEVVIGVDFSMRPFVITTKRLFADSSNIKKYRADACIIATGATPNLLNVPGEDKYWTKGVYTCAVCDGALYKDKTVAVVGGGDSALVEAHYLANLAKKVYLIVRNDHIRAVEKKRAEEILAHPRVEVLYESVIKEIKGDSAKVTHLLVHDKSKDMHFDLAADALFLAIGARPNTDLFRNQVELNEKSYIVLKKTQQTSVEGVYAVGDVADEEFKQAISAAGDAAKAALQAQKFLSQQGAPVRPKKEKIASAPSKKKRVIDIVSRAHFEKELKKANGPIFLDFYATWCGPCRTFGPVYDGWANDYSEQITFLKVNADVAGELFQSYRVTSIPTLAVLTPRGEMICKLTGHAEIAKIDKCLQNIKNKQSIDVYTDFAVK
jgi:thioredoxin reductase (NADPH)